MKMIKILILVSFICLIGIFANSCKEKQHKGKEKTIVVSYDTTRLIYKGIQYIQKKEHDIFMKIVEHHTENDANKSQLCGRYEVDVEGHITEVFIHGFSGKKMPEEFYKLTRIQKIELYDCVLEEFPKIEAFSEIKKIIIWGKSQYEGEHNKANFGKILISSNKNHLEVLKIRFIPVESIEFENNIPIQRLEISSSTLKRIPPTLCNLRFLVEVILFENPFEVWDFDYSCIPSNVHTFLIGTGKTPEYVVEKLKPFNKFNKFFHD